MTHAAFFPNPLKLGLYQKLKDALDRIRENHGKKKTSLYTRAQYEAVIQASSEMNIPLRPWLDSDKGESPIFTVPSTEQILFRDDLTEADWAPHLPEGNLRMREKLQGRPPPIETAPSPCLFRSEPWLPARRGGFQGSQG